MRCCASRVTTGPISLSWSRPEPTLTARARSLTAATTASAAEPTATAAEIAMHRSPAEPNAAAARWSAAKSTSASGRMMAWFLAPPRAWTRLPFAVPRWWMYLAIGVDPTNDTAATSGESRIVSTASLSPCTTLKTPSGRPASFQSSAIRIDADGSRSLGLRTNVFPQAIATGNIHIGTMAGKLNGVMPATTPSGSRNEYVSTSVDTWSEKSPLSREAMPHANSTTSSPRCTSPSASESTLPCSSVISSAISLACAFTSSRKANSTFVRRLTEVCAHAGKASAAAPMAARTSAADPSRTSACCWPVAGLYTAAVRSLSPPEVVPEIQWSIVLKMVFSL